MKSCCIHICILLCLYVYNLYGQTPDDNIIITKCSDSYILRRKTASPLYPTGKRYPMKQQEWEPLCNPTPITESSSHWTRLLPKGEGKPNIKASHRKMSSLTTAKSAFSISTLTGKGKNRSIVQAHFSRPALFYAGLPGRRLLHQRKATDIHHPAIAFPLPPDGKNFSPAIHCERSINSAGDSVFTYIVTNMSAMKDEKQMPATGKVYPHILITGSFKDYHDMYCWSNKLAQVDCNVPEINILLAKITAGCHTDMGKYAIRMPGYNRTSATSPSKQAYWATGPILPQKFSANVTVTAKECHSCSAHC